MLPHGAATAAVYLAPFYSGLVDLIAVGIERPYSSNRHIQNIQILACTGLLHHWIDYY